MKSLGYLKEDLGVCLISWQDYCYLLGSWVIYIPYYE